MFEPAPPLLPKQRTGKQTKQREMDLKPRTPLPPGMVPSASTEDLPGILEEEQRTSDQQSKDIVKEGSFSGPSEDTSASTDAVRSPAVAPGTPPEAWRSATEEQAPDTYHIDLSGNDEEETENGTNTVPIFQGISTPELGKVPRRKLWSPFSRSKNKVQDLREEVLSRSDESFSEKQATPKRLFSPLRKNKIAPSPRKPPPSEPGGTASPIRTQALVQPLSTAELELVGASLEESTAPTTADGEDHPPLSPIVIVKSKERAALVIENKHQESISDNGAQSSVASVEPLYSSVVKPKHKARAESSSSETQSPHVSNLITVLPKLETFEAQSTIDNSLMVENQSAQTPSPDHTHTDEHAYELVDAPDLAVPDMPVYSASVYKELKKHQDAGNIHLVSVKGTVQNLPNSSHSGSFPEGSSTDLSPLHYAAASGDKKELARLLSILPITQDPVEMVLGTEKMCGREGLEMLDSEGRTPLMHAVHNNHLHSVKMLAEVGANINAVAIDGSTGLHQAAYSGSIDMVALLLSLGADGLKRDNEGRTPLHWCTNNTQPDTIDLILDKVPGLSVDVRDGAMMTPLMWAAFHGHQQHVIKLIERGAELHLTDIDGMTAAHWSVQRNDTRTLQMLISPESASYHDNKGKTVMHQAAERGSAKAVSMIKAVKPTSVNDQDMDGRTPLHWATACENPEVVRALLAVGADPAIQDHSGLTALDYANQKGLHYCALLLSQAEGFDDPDSFGLVPTYGATTAGFGARALQQQEGQLLNMADVQSILSQDQITQIQTVCQGTCLNKFSNEGRGQAHTRYFWVNPSNTKICWAKEKDAASKDTKSDTLVGVRSSSSPAVFSRKDFDPKNKHKYSFTIFTASRVLDVVALSSDDYKLWLNGLQLLLHLGSINTTKLLSIVQNASGEQRPIP